MRKDIENLEDGDEIVLYPKETNPIHSRPILTTFVDGYFFCADNRGPSPDYYFRNVLEFNKGFTTHVL